MNDVAPTPAPRPDWLDGLNDPAQYPGDGGCTGIPSGWVNPELLKCCTEHDAGGRDGVLLDCATDALDGLPIALVCFAVFLMTLLRPLYNRLQRWGWVK